MSVNMLIASVYLSIEEWEDEEIARPVTEERLQRQIAEAGAITTVEVEWVKEALVWGDEVFFVMHGCQYGYKRGSSNE